MQLITIDSAAVPTLTRLQRTPCIQPQLANAPALCCQWKIPQQIHHIAESYGGHGESRQRQLTSYQHCITEYHGSYSHNNTIKLDPGHIHLTYFFTLTICQRNCVATVIHCHFNKQMGKASSKQLLLYSNINTEIHASCKNTSDFNC